MTGITAVTKDCVMYGHNGYLKVTAVDVGATVGDFQVEWGADQYYPDLHQAMGPVVGTGKITGGFFRLSCTIAEFDYTNLVNVLGDVGADSTGSSEKFGGKALENVSEVTDVVLYGVERNDAKDVMVTIPAAYVEVGSIGFSKTGESTLELTFHGLYAAATPSTLPGYIEIEK